MRLLRYALASLIALTLAVAGVGANAQSASRLLMLDMKCAGPAGFPLLINFVKNCSAGGVSAANITTTRTTTNGIATAPDANGNYYQFANNASRVTSLGIWNEEARTNGVRNPIMSGAVVMADGVNLISNPTFSGCSGSVCIGWTVNINGGSVSFSGGVATITGNGTDNTNYISVQITNTSGRGVVCGVGQSSAGFQFFAGTSAGNASILGTTNIAGNGSASTNSDRAGFVIPAGGTAWATWARFAASAGAINNGVFCFDGERVENGTFSTNPLNASQSTVQNGGQWKIAGGTSTVTYASNQVTLTPDGTNRADFSTAAIPTVNGFTYTVTVDIGTNTANINVGTVAYGSTLLNATAAVGAGQKFQFTATSSTSFVDFGRQSSGAVTIANLSVQSAGALPTNWQVQSQPAGLIRTITAVNTVNGIPGFAVNWSGTTTANGTIQLVSDGVAAKAIAATYGQTWAGSWFFQVLQDDASVPSIANELWAYATDGLTFLNIPFSTSISNRTAWQRVVGTGTPTNTQTAFLQQMLRGTSTINSGTTVNETWWVGAPQLENNSTINSAVSSASKAADGTGGVNGTAVYSVGGGTCSTTPTLNVTWAAGVLTVNSAANAGSCTVLPPSPAALTYVSGTATGWTGATANLIPVSNSSQAFATTPVLSNGTTAGARGTENSTVALPWSATGYAIQAAALTQMPAANPNFAVAVEVDDATGNNRALVRRNGGGNGEIAMVSGGTTQYTTSLGAAWPSNALNKIAGSFAAAGSAGSVNGSTPVTPGAGTLPVSPSVLRIGSGVSAQSINGYVASVAANPYGPVASGVVQAATQ